MHRSEFTPIGLMTRVNETGRNRSVRPGYGLGRYQTGPNSKFKFKFKKIKIPKPVIPTGKPVKPAGKPVKAGNHF